jgi:hypothetical protein
MKMTLRILRPMPNAAVASVPNRVAMPNINIPVNGRVTA